MTIENSAGLNVSNQYGPRTSGKTIGRVKTEGSYNELKFDIDASMFTAGGPALVVDYKLPAGAVVKDATVKVTEAFVMTGTTPNLAIGTDTSEATNGVLVTEAQGEAVATYVLSPIGTWAAPLAAETTIGFALEGDTAITGAGALELIIGYIVV